MNHLKYWNKQFGKNGQVWGNTASKSVQIASNLFSEGRARKILIPGVGYGRNSKPFSEVGFKVTGIEISEAACAIAKEYDRSLQIINKSLFEIEDTEYQFDAIYCYDVLHLFGSTDRLAFIDKCASLTKPNGQIFFTALSDEDDYFGSGREVEENTFEVKPGKLIHFFSEDDLVTSFQQFKLVSVGSLTDSIEHVEHGPKQYQVRYICVLNEKGD